LHYRTLLTPQRVGILDETRGLCLLLMVAYHSAYDIVYLFGVDIPAFHWPILRFAQPFVAGIFVLISGACCRYSNNNLRRGLLALGTGLLMTAVTWRLMPGQAIWFGILHFLGCAMILFHLLQTPLDVLPPFWGICAMLLGLALCWYIPFGTAVLGQVTLPAVLYQFPFLFPLGFPARGFASADYFPLLPWIFCFFAGSHLGLLFLYREMPVSWYRTHSRFLGAVGRRSLLIYVFHQPVIYAVLTAFFWVMRNQLGLL